MAQQDPQSSLEKLQGSAMDIGESISNIPSNVGQKVTNAIADTGFGKALRSIGLLPGADRKSVV